MKFPGFSILIVFVAVSLQASAQSAYDTLFRPPLDIPLRVSGTFQELRSNHFHSGIDLKTQYQEGKIIHSIADGYIYRINVSPGGYGRAIYVRHDSLLSVYGHLREFSPEIEAYVKQAQYKLKSYSVNLFLPPHQFPVSKSDTLGFSGNSGSSAGPHLHFEIRDFKSEHPMNALNYGLKIADHRPPLLYDVYLYEFPRSYPTGKYLRKKLPVQKTGTSYIPVQDAPQQAESSFALGMRSYDYLDGSHNRCGLYTITVLLDADTVFHFRADEFAFRNTRYINSMIDRKAYIHNDRRIMKLFREPRNKLSSYKKLRNNGIMQLQDDSLHSVRLILKDHADNTSNLSFDIRRKKLLQRKAAHKAAKVYPLDYRKHNTLQKQGMLLHVPDSALYTNYYLKIRQTGNSPFGPEYQIGASYHLFQHPVKLRIKAAIPQHYRDKAVLIRQNEEGDKSFLPANYKNGFVSAHTRRLGRFKPGLDTLAPRIRPLNVYEGKACRPGQTLRFRIEDKESGIASFEAFLAGKWMLMEYDAKNHLLFHRVDGALFSTKAEKRKLKVRVKDRKANTAIYETTITY